MSLFNKFLFFNFLLAFISFSNSTFSRLKKDTIYFDENWSICEKPVAEYYRVASLNVANTIFYTGAVTDYYLSGIPEITGSYNDKGFRNGSFIFYNLNGKILRSGNFENDEMKGIWNYYDENGVLKVRLNCKSATDFAPVLIINNSGDTIIKNGNGHFIFNSQNDLPNIFPVWENYTVEGNVVNGNKDGTINYWVNFNSDKKNIFCTEIYNDGKFKRGNQTGMVLNSPVSVLNLFAKSSLNKTDVFDHSNMVFGGGQLGDLKLANYLVYGQEPELKSESNTYEENIKDFYKILGNVLRRNLQFSGANDVSYSNPSEETTYNLLSFSVPFGLSISPRNIHCNAIFTIDTDGYVSNSVFKGSVTTQEINKMNYYLSRLSGLVPYEKDGGKTNSDITISLFGLIDTIKNDSGINLLYYRYIAVKGNIPDEAQFKAIVRAEMPKVEDYYKEYKTVQIEAKFPGGADAWMTYLQKNLRQDVPTENGAPPGIYRVVVSFLVDKEGNISEVRAENDPGYGTGAEVVRVMQHGPKWIPAVQHGHNVIYRQRQSITFQVSKQ